MFVHMGAIDVLQLPITIREDEGEEINIKITE